MSSATTPLELDSDPAKVAELHPHLLALAQAAGLDTRAAFQLTAVIIEAVNNCIKHGYHCEPGHPIGIAWRCLGESIDIEIRDRGRPLPQDVLAGAAMPAPDDESGRGWPIIQEWTDAVRYARIGDENVLNLTRRRDVAPSSPLASRSTPMKLELESRDGIDCVRLPERLMMAEAPDARRQLKEIILSGSGKLILDLTRTEVLDSSGLAVLVGSLQVARKKGGDIFLIGMDNNVRALFELTRLHTVFQVFDDEERARSAMT